MTYPESLKVAVVKFDPPSLEIDAIMSVFNVGVATFSSNTTILDVVGTLVEVKGYDIIVVDVVVAGAEPVRKTKPSPPAPGTW